ncbi:mannonate dehydratase [Paenalkalicoccus suaedae]|uniref:Mannonate dehydratase n=1 Tax=Paenalkalicoccus suaedae TaxID=2592382 RepID=A0A859FJI2_9BACI|nr:mannonate dehydratase [Paenalkalicoccus suaedae]QKS72960.1 mannonate dehydratase [Paenalkalicoccus suaedae]
MNMTLRWFGHLDDSVTLKQIKQIPKVGGIVGTLNDLKAGEAWPLSRIRALHREVTLEGFSLEVIESVNIHEDIKLGLPSRDKYIEAYIETIRRLASVGVKVICYNFMPVFDWTRSDLAKVLPDKSTVLAYERAKVEAIDPNSLLSHLTGGAGGFSLPGWEPERLQEIVPLLEAYQHITEEQLFLNLTYFLEKTVPVAAECGVKLAIHPDDPPWPVFGLPRIVKNKSDLIRIIEAVDHPSNSLTLCSGSLGASLTNDLSDIFQTFLERDRVAFVHLRNIRHEPNGDFYETAHCDEAGSVPMTHLIKLLSTYNYQGFIRPDHGRMIWGEKARPGYGLYDRALGAMYIQGQWDSFANQREGRSEYETSRNA